VALSWIVQDEAGIRLSVRVQPRASRTEVAGLHDGALKIRLASPPVDGAANKALVAFLAKRLGVPKSDVLIAHGQRGRLKSIRVRGLQLSSALERFGDFD